MVPFPAAVQHPLFIADIPGWKNDNVPKSMTFEEDRRYLEDAISRLAAKSRLPIATRISDLLANSFERQFFELSLRNKHINREWIRCRNSKANIDVGLALEQLNAFVSLNMSMANHPSVTQVRDELLSNGNGVPQDWAS